MKLALMIATDLETYSLVYIEGFQHFVRYLDQKYVIVSQNNLKDTLNRLRGRVLTGRIR